MAANKRRSVLYVPGSNLGMMEKAGSRGADVLVLDLEDGVHPDLKNVARERVHRLYRQLDWGGSEVFIRANGLDTPWGKEDIAMIKEIGAAAGVLPKAEKTDLVETVARSLGEVPLFLMVETAAGVLAAAALSRVAGVSGLFFGAADYRESMRAGRLPEEEELLFARSQILNAARASRVEAFDTPWFEYRNLEGLEASARRARLLGFDGKTAVHPAQVPVINRVFSPTAEELEHARAVVEVMEQALAQGRNVASLGNEMVESLHLAAARRVLARANG